MTSQIFKNIYPKKDLLDFLKKYTTHHQKYLLFSKSSFKKIKLDNMDQQFFDTLKPYYHKSKQFYITRKPVYKHFITVIKQLCKINNIPYDSNIIYSKSTYELQYKIFHTFELNQINKKSSTILSNKVLDKDSDSSSSSS